PRSKVFS
ncbi:NLPA lipofamily protein, partial [Vibrio parahaemolyticus V-223/04]